MNEQRNNSTGRKFLLGATAALLLTLIGLTSGPLIARGLPPALASRIGLATAPIAAASFSPASAGDAAVPGVVDSVTFTLFETNCGYNTSATFSIGGTSVGTLNYGYDCDCYPGSKTFTLDGSNDPDGSLRALAAAPMCATFGVQFGGGYNGRAYLLGSVKADVVIDGATTSVCMADASGNDCAPDTYICDAYSYNVSSVQSTLPDTDGDAVADCSDPDIDGDGVANDADFCPAISDPTNADSDGDGYGDACEAVVRAVPWLGLPNKAHEVYSGGSLILGGTATYGFTDKPASIASATWDPGDGSAAVSVPVTNPLNLELTHTYSGADGQPYTAVLTVVTSEGQTATDTFKVVVKTKTVDVEANMAIDKGLWYIHKQIQRSTAGAIDIGMVSGSSNLAATAGSVQAMQINNHVTTGQIQQDPYIHDVARMMHWLESQMQVRSPLNVQPSGNPDTNGNGYGLFANDNSVNYIVGQVMDAFVSSGTPDKLAVLGPSPQVQGRKYKDIVQDMMDFNAMSQMDYNSNQKGSWHYGESDNASIGHADNSIAQWPAIGGIAAERVWGLTTPAFVKNDMLGFLPYTHDTGTGNVYSGASSTGSFGYGHSGAAYAWSENFATTPSALVQYIWGGVNNNPTPATADETRFQSGLQFMARYHRVKNGYSCCDATFGGINFYGLYATTKAYRLATNASGVPTPITLIDDNPADSVPAWHWYYNDPAVGAPASAGPVGVARAVINNQQPSGQFPGAGSWTGNLSTAWGVIILSPSLFQLGPTAVCTANPSQIGSFGGTVTFNGSGSFHNDDDGVIASYAWNFGDGGTAATANASHTYAASATPNTFNATLTVTDANGLTDTATCTVTQVNTNVAPDADTGGPYSFCKGGTLILDGTGSNDEEDGNALTYEWDITSPITFSPVDGTGATFNASAHFSSLPAGTYDIGLRVTDSLGVQNSEFSQVTVKNANDPGCNQPPVATNNAYTTAEDTPVSGNAVTDAPADSDPDSNPMTASLVSGTANGALTLGADGSFTYTPNANFCGTDSFTYKVNDGTVDSNVATVTIDVTCVNDPPVANDNAHTTPEDTPVSGVATSSDTDGGAPTYALASSPSNGTVVFNADGTYTYTPNANYNGPDAFNFSVSDGNGGSDTGTVTIDVTPVNDVPVCTATPSIAQIWPPNHQLVSISVLGATDVEGPVSITIDSIWQDEPTNAAGSGNTPVDGYGIGTSTAQVRAERIGNPKAPGDGRMYHIFFTGTDAGGATCTGSVKVGVPHDQGNGSTVIDGGPLYKSHP